MLIRGGGKRRVRPSQVFKELRVLYVLKSGLGEAKRFCATGMQSTSVGGGNGRRRVHQDQMREVL